MSKENIELDIDLGLPDHSEQLYDTEIYVSKIRKELQDQKKLKELNDFVYETLYTRITKALYYVGKLSMPAFNIEEKLEEEYFNVYQHAPELARKLWLDHYSEIHRPYNILKNRLFRLFDELDEAYISINKKEPPQL